MELVVIKHLDDLLTKMRVFLKYVTHSFSKYQIYIRIHCPILEILSLSSVCLLYVEEYSFFVEL